MSNRYPPEEIVPALIHHNREARRYAAKMLGVHEDDQLVPFLTDLLQSGSVPARRSAALALGTPSRPFSAPYWAGWSAPTIDRLAVESLTASLGDPDAVVRANSALSLAGLCRFADRTARLQNDAPVDMLRSDAVALPLAHALEDPVVMVRIQAATALSVLAIPAALPALIRLLQDPDWEVRAAAAVAAGNLGALQSLPILLEILRDGSRDSRRQAVVSLRRLGDADAVPALMDALTDTSRAVRQEAVVALGQLGDSQAVPSLMNLLSGTNIMAEERRSLREDLVIALGCLGDRQAVPALIRALYDYDKHIRYAAVQSLVQLDGPQAGDAMIAFVGENMYDGRPGSTVRQVICELGAMGTVRAMPVLRLVIEQGDQRLVTIAARALGELGDTITAGDMVEWLSSPDSDNRLRVVLALPALVGRDALPQLLDALADHDSTVRARGSPATGALGRPERHPIPCRCP